MKSVVAYVRTLLGWVVQDDPAIKSSFKRDRTDDDLLCDEAPALKRLRQLNKSSFPSTESSNDIWDREESKNVRYVPIQVEKGHPSTSTPIDMSRSNSRKKTRVVKLVDLSENVPLTPTRNHSKPRNNVPKRPILHDDVDDDDDEVTWVASKPVKPNKPPPNLYIDLNEEVPEQVPDEEEYENDVIYVKHIPGPDQPFKLYKAQNDQQDSVEDDVPYYRLSRNLNDRKSTLSPKSYTRFKAPAGITKTYKKTPLPRFLQAQKPPTSASRSRLLNMNGSNIRSTLSEVFNLDEKKNYQELIRRVAGTTKPMTFGKPSEIINIAEDSASFRNTQRAQKKSLNELKLVEKELIAERESEASREYDPITVASINSSDSEIEVVPSESSSSSVRIDPINTLKESYRGRAITSTDWVQKLESKYKKRLQDTEAKLKEARRESDIISKVNHEQNIAYVQHKLKYELCIPECLIEEAQPAVELPELTPEQEKLINRAMGPGPAGQLIVEKFNLRIHRRDLQTLAGLNWLNDEVINFYMNLLMQRSQERKDLPKVYAANTFFYPKLMQSGQAGLRRWTRKVDIFAHDLMVAPVHLGVHWCMSMVDFRGKKIQYLDSMGGRNQGCLEALMQYLHDEHQDKKGAPFDDKGWKLETLSKDIPQQMNGSDCGMFSCTFAEFAARNAPYTFTQSHMPYLRRKAALEIITGKLLL